MDVADDLLHQNEHVEIQKRKKIFRLAVKITKCIGQ